MPFAACKEIVETTKKYMRNNMPVYADWVIDVAPHLTRDLNVGEPFEVRGKLYQRVSFVMHGNRFDFEAELSPSAAKRHREAIVS
jgi:hypothetical protein